jgi:hypothetical protein
VIGAGAFTSKKLRIAGMVDFAREKPFIARFCNVLRLLQLSRSKNARNLSTRHPSPLSASYDRYTHPSPKVA